MGVKERWVRTKPIPVPTDRAVEIVADALRGDGCVTIAYLFGSRRGNSHSPDSDLDVAFRTEGGFSWDDYLELSGALTRALRSDRLDLLWLNEADPVICFEVVRTCRVLFSRDADTLNDFELKAKKRYYDYALYLARHRKAVSDGA